MWCAPSEREAPPVCSFFWRLLYQSEKTSSRRNSHIYIPIFYTETHIARLIKDSLSRGEARSYRMLVRRFLRMNAKKKKKKNTVWVQCGHFQFSGVTTGAGCPALTTWSSMSRLCHSWLTLNRAQPARHDHWHWFQVLLLLCVSGESWCTRDCRLENCGFGLLRQYIRSKIFRDTWAKCRFHLQFWKERQQSTAQWLQSVSFQQNWPWQVTGHHMHFGQLFWACRTGEEAHFH